MKRVPIPGPDAIRQEYKRLVKAHVEHLTKTRPDLKPSTVYGYAKRNATAGKWPPGYSRIPPIELVDVTTQPPPPLYNSDALRGSQGHLKTPDIVPPELLVEYAALPYSPPLFSYQDANNNPVAELASRELCRRRLLPFIKRFRPNYTAGWFHSDICRRVERFIERVERKESPRLLLMAPPRSGKSEILSRNAPAWIIGKHPDWELIAASYAGALTMTFSRYIRDLLRDPAYQALYPTTKLDPSSQSVEAWNTTRGGGYVAVGQGGPITGKGAHCFPAGTKVRTTTGYVTIETLRTNDKVLGYDHDLGEIRSARVEGVRISRRADIVRITTTAGRIIVATADHPFFVVGTGYVQAEVLGIGATLLVASMPTVRETEVTEVEALQGLLPRCEEGSYRGGMRAVLEGVHEAAIQLQKESEQRSCDALLFDRVLPGASRCEERQVVPCLPTTCGVEGKLQGRKVLQPRVSRGCECEVVEDGMSGLRDNVPAALSNEPVLLEGVCQCCTQRSDVGREQLELQRRPELQPLVPHSARSYPDEGPEQVRHLCEHREPLGAPCQSREDGQPSREPRNHVSHVPCSPSQVGQDTVLMVEKLCGDDVEVYDIQVEGTSNFFAEEILAHNCFFIDDIVKDHEAAQSLSQRESTWAWWTSTAYTRLAPGGGVLALMTNWHADDWAGRIQETMLLGGEVYEVIKYPAINDYGDEYILPDDSIIQIADKEPVPQGALMTRPKNTAIHPERYDTQHMLRIKNNLEMSGQKAVWNALYQQNPVPDEGSFFQKDMFRYYSTAPARRDMYIYQAWDFAISTGKENDYTVGITIGVDHRDAVYVLDMRRFRSGDGIEIAQTILEYSIEWGTNAIGVEDGQIWKAIESQFLKACEEHHSRHFPSYEPLKPLTDKKVRADPLRGRMQAGKVYFDKEAHYFSVMQNELLHFPNAKHDDCHTYTTLVECRHGQMMIGRLRDGDEILSYDGVDVVVGKVSQHHCTGVKEVIEITFSDGVTLELTPSHPVLTARGYVYAGDLTTHDDVVRRDVCRYRNTASNGQKSFLATTSPPQTSTELGDGCTATPMSRSEDLSRTGTTSTTSMATKTTTTCVTSSACQAFGTGRNTAQTWWCSAIHHSSSIISHLSDSLPWLRKRVSMSARANCESACRESVPAQSAVRSSRRLSLATTPLRTVLQSALTKSEMYIQRLLTKLQQHARTAISPSYLVATPSDENCIVQQPAGTSTGMKIDISRESAHRVGRATISGKVTHQCSVESVLSQGHPNTDTSAHAAVRRFYPESKMARYSAIESVLTSTEDLAVMQRASTDSNRQFVKVVSVRRIGYHETYNFEVDGTRNFLVQGGIVVHNCVDSLAWAVRLTLTRTPPRPARPPVEKSWRDKLKAHMAGSHGGATHMSA